MKLIDITRGQRGSAMVISLLALLVLTMVGTLFLATSNTENPVGDAMW